MTFHGSLATFALIDLLQWIEHHSVSGRLSLERGGARRVVDIARGRIIFASSTLPHERLGTFLVERGYLPPETMYEALARHLLSHQNLTRLLAEGGLLDEGRLRIASTELAEAIIFDSFNWGSDATFRFEPGLRAEPRETPLTIQLSLEAQILAFRGAKKLDDTSRQGGPPRPAPAEGAAPKRIESDDDALFWAAADRAAVEDRGLSPEEIRERQAGFRAFAAHARKRAEGPATIQPTFAEIAGMLHPRLVAGEAADDFVLQLAALDPAVAANLLVLGNCLTTDRAHGLSTPREALVAAGRGPIATLLAGMTAPEVPQRTSDDPLELLGWRSVLGRAVAAAHLAELFGLDREEAYFLGLLSDLGYAEMVPLLIEIPLPSRAFRLATLEQLAPEIGRRVADRCALPRVLSEVIAFPGAVRVDSPPHIHLVFLARDLSPPTSWGIPWHGDGCDADEIRGMYGVPPDLRETIRADVSRIFEFLGLPS